MSLVAEPGRASIYSPDGPRFNVTVGADGKTHPLPLDDFLGAMAVLTNARDERKIGDRKPFLERIAQAEKKNLSADETAALAADLVRIGRLDDAQNRLAARLRDRNPNYFVFTTYAAIRATAGDWAEALRYHTAAAAR